MEANGNGGSTRLSLTAGAHGDRWRAAGSIEHYDRDELTLRDRAFTRCQTDGFRNNRDFIDPLTGESKCYPLTTTGSNGVTINTIGAGVEGARNANGNRTFLGTTGVGAAGSVGTVFNRWRPNAGVNTGVIGFEGVGGGANNLNVRDTTEDRKLNTSLISPVEITTIYGEGGYQLHALGNAELYGEVLFNNRKSSQTGYRQLSLDYAKGSPLILATWRSAPSRLTKA